MGMPSVMSTWARRQPTHMLAGLGGMGTPHWQHRLEHREELVRLGPAAGRSTWRPFNPTDAFFNGKRCRRRATAPRPA